MELFVQSKGRRELGACWIFTVGSSKEAFELAC